MYGEIPLSRWNHSLVSVNENKLVIFGGLNMNTYMHSSNLWIFEMGDQPVERFVAKAYQKVSDLAVKAK